MDDLLLMRALKDVWGMVCDYERGYFKDLLTTARPGLVSINEKEKLSECYSAK